MAAKNWDIPAYGLKAENGMVVNMAANKKISYGELTKGRQILLTISDKVQVTIASDWQIAGKSVPKVNGLSFITGQHIYVSDMKSPGMTIGKAFRQPSYNVKLIESAI